MNANEIKSLDSTKPKPSKIAIIIDDIGHNRAKGSKALALSGALTYGIIPHSPYAKYFAQQAAEKNKEIILHVPMSNLNDKPIEENVLTSSMTEEIFQKNLQSSLSSVPNIRGINNHMGSLLTQEPVPMEWLMTTLQAEGLFFIDSRTTSNSLAFSTAKRFNVPSLKRDIFLDHEPTIEFIEKQFLELIALSKRRGYAVAIAHPYKNTINFLEENIPRLEALQVDLVPVSQVVYSQVKDQKITTQ